MTTLIYILSLVVFVQSIAIIYLVGREFINSKKRKEIIKNQTKITHILTIYSKRLNIRNEDDKGNSDDNKFLLN